MAILKKRSREGRNLPIGIQYGSCVTTEEGNLIGCLSALAERDNGKGASTARLPINSNELGVDLKQESQAVGEWIVFIIRYFESTDSDEPMEWLYLYKIRIPGIAANVQIIIAKFFSSRLAKDVACGKKKSEYIDREVTRATTLAVSFFMPHTVLWRPHESARHGREQNDVGAVRNVRRRTTKYNKEEESILERGVLVLYWKCMYLAEKCILWLPTKWCRALKKKRREE